MRKEYKTKRVEFAQYCLDTYGTEVSYYSTWSRLINSDFSAYIRNTGSHNTKTDVIWCESRKDGGDLLEFYEKMFYPSVPCGQCHYCWITGNRK